MKPRARGSAISARRAFVVHLAMTGSAAGRRFSGLVEHLSPGESARFMSLKELRAFFVARLDAGASAAPREGTQDESFDTSKP